MREKRTASRSSINDRSRIDVSETPNSKPWNLVAVKLPVTRSSFAYTNGLFESTGLPEVIVSGLPDDLLIPFLGGVVDQLAAANSEVVASRVRDDLTDQGRNIVFEPVDNDQKHILGECCRFYAGHHFPCMQLFFSDAGNKFPWEPEYSLGFQKCFSNSTAVLHPTYANLSASRLLADDWKVIHQSWSNIAKSLFVYNSKRISNTGFLSVKHTAQGFFLFDETVTQMGETELQTIDPGEFDEIELDDILAHDSYLIEALDAPVGFTAFRSTAAPLWKFQRG